MVSISSILLVSPFRGAIQAYKRGAIQGGGQEGPGVRYRAGGAGARLPTYMKFIYIYPSKLKVLMNSGKNRGHTYLREKSRNANI